MLPQKMAMRLCICKMMLILLPVFIGCKGSDVYRGDWKALDKSGFKYDINFDAENITVKYGNGNVEKFEYTQHSVSLKNSTRKYGIKLKDGRTFYIIFPIANETGKGVMTLDTMDPLYTLGRNGYVPFNEMLKL